MRTAVLAGVWVYIIVAVIAEVEAAMALAGGALVMGVVGILAVSQAVAITLFYMGLKDEPGSMRLFVLVPLLFIAALLISMVASLG